LFLQPDAPAGKQILVSAPAGQLGSVTVQEPSTAALVLAAMLALLAWRAPAARRR
jgi:hypothetical protein